MNILILGLNYAPEPVGIGVYTSGAAEYLSQVGHDVAVVCGKPYYPEWKVAKEYRTGSVMRSEEAGVRVRRVPLYVPSKPSGLRRLIHHACFAVLAFPEMLRAARFKRPQVVFCVAPSLVSVLTARAIAKIYKAQLWLHVQDFEVEAAFATNMLSNRGLGGLAARAFQRWCLSRGIVSTISPQMLDKLHKMGIPKDRTFEFRNWANIDHIRPLSRPSAYREHWGITTPHVALYSGNLGNKQGLEIIPQAARILVDRNDLTFVICGGGALKDHLKAEAAGLPNVRFFDLQPAGELNELLGLATVHLLPQIANAADLVLPSKMANMLASGRPVLATAVPGTGIANELEGCGRCVPPGDPAALAKSLVAILDDEPTRDAYGRVARAKAEQHWGRSQILATFAAEISGKFARRPSLHGKQAD